MTSKSELEQRLEFVHQKPVLAGLSFAAEEYVYSSASPYAGKVEVLKVEVLA